MVNQDEPAQLDVEREGENHLRIVLSGNWQTRTGLPDHQEISRELEQLPSVNQLSFDTSRLGDWNSGLLALLTRCSELCRARQIEFQLDSLPKGLKKLVELSEAVPDKEDARRGGQSETFLYHLGKTGMAAWSGSVNLLTFIGDVVIAFFRMLRGKAQFRWSDTFLVMQECGPAALGIVALINFLIGLILAFVGAVQLTQFGASIYVADLVAIATVREMGCIMTGIILCGRTGAAFAAQLGTMKVNEEINALQTFGISATEFLVLPRMLALIVMMPILVVFADLISIAGGFVAAMATLDITPTEYIDRTIQAIKIKSFLLGIGKGCFFGVIVALFGCLRGIQCGNNAAAVGLATTSAVVAGITAIIAADGVFAVITSILGI